MSKMIGRRFGKLVVVSGDSHRFVCRCDCGKEILAWWTNLIQGRKTHCGCGKYADRDEKGKKYGRWMVIARHQGSVEYWECRCDCGNEGVVSRSNLRSGNSQSCGCLQRERAAEAGRKNRRFNVADAKFRKTRPNIISWRRRVIERDGGCRICGTTEKLSAHHKDGWLLAKDKRMDVSNGVTVCFRHHNDFHRQYGKGQTTAAQWDEYESRNGGGLSTRILPILSRP